MEVRLESSTRISWTRVRRHSTIVDRSVTLTDNAAVDLFQQHILGQGSQVRQTGARGLHTESDGDSQSNESAIEQLKDEQIASAIRMAFKSTTGNELKKEK